MRIFLDIPLISIYQKGLLASVSNLFLKHCFDFTLMLFFHLVCLSLNWQYLWQKIKLPFVTVLNKEGEVFLFFFFKLTLWTSATEEAQQSVSGRRYPVMSCGFGLAAPPRRQRKGEHPRWSLSGGPRCRSRRRRRLLPASSHPSAATETQGIRAGHRQHL